MYTRRKFLMNLTGAGVGGLAALTGLGLRRPGSAAAGEGGPCRLVIMLA